MRVLLILLAAAIGSSALTAQSTTPIPGDDQARCKTGDLASCVRSETTRCDAGEATACVDLSHRYFGGVAVSRDQKRGEQLYARAFHLADSTCTAGELSGCAIVGLAYATGRGVRQDLDRAKALEERACAGGNDDGCFDLGYFSLLGLFGFARDSIRAAQLLEATCKRGHANACFQLGWNYEFGRTVAPDRQRAAVFYQQACDAARDTNDVMGLMGCHFLGSAYDEGRGVTEDAAHAGRLYDRACQGGNGSGCNNLGHHYQEGRAVAKDASRAAQLYDRACQLGNPSGCDNLSLLYERGNGVPRDADRANQLRQQACALGFRPACKNAPFIPFMMGFHYGAPLKWSVVLALSLPAGTEKTQPFVAAEPGIGGWRASVGYLRIMSDLGSGYVARATLLRTNNNAWSVAPQSTFAGAELQFMPLFAIGARLGGFLPIGGSGKRRGLMTADISLML